MGADGIDLLRRKVNRAAPATFTQADQFAAASCVEDFAAFASRDEDVERRDHVFLSIVIVSKIQPFTPAQAVSGLSLATLGAF
jgi:hypothetical protein